MEIYSGIAVLREFIGQSKDEKKSIGFVPTMGALHDGHLELIRKSKRQNDVTVCSIFVNPTQFNNPSDLKNYPRNTEEDLKLLSSLNCDAVFLPPNEVIYEESPITSFDFGYLEQIMEGKYRPGHFKGVALVVSKLFNIVRPHRAYFGKKDLQQLTIIQTMVRELFFDVQIIPVETVRESDGLAMSSRNLLLNEEERNEATGIYKALSSAKEKLINNENIESVKKFVHDFFTNQSSINLEYFEVVNRVTLKDVEQINESKEVSLCIAGYLGKVRLIDNMSLI